MLIEDKKRVQEVCHEEGVWCDYCIEAMLVKNCMIDKTVRVDMNDAFGNLLKIEAHFCPECGANWDELWKQISTTRE